MYRPAPAGLTTTRNDHVTVYLVMPSRQDAHPPVPWRHIVECADTTTRNTATQRSCHSVVLLRHFSLHRQSFLSTPRTPDRRTPTQKSQPRTKHTDDSFSPKSRACYEYVNTPTVCGVCCIAGYELRNSFGRSKWFRDSAGGCRLGKQPKRSAAELDQRRRRAAAPPPPCGCAGPSPGARARKRVVGFCAVLVAGCSLVVPVRVPVGVRGFWVTCEGPLSAPDAHAPAGGAHNGHQ